MRIQIFDSGKLIFFNKCAVILTLFSSKAKIYSSKVSAKEMSNDCKVRRKPTGSTVHGRGKTIKIGGSSFRPRKVEYSHHDEQGDSG
jgi:hypothetical protein